MRFTSLLSFSVLFSLAACAKHDDAEDMRSSVIVFGITQRTDPTTGAAVTTAGHEYLKVGAHSISFGPWAAQRQSLPDGWCRTMETTADASRPNVGDGGRARFSGGAIAADGIVLDANGAEPVYAGRAFEPAVASVRFAVERGFAIPGFDPIELPAPNTALRLSTPSPDAIEVSVDGDRDFQLEWASREEPDANVMIAFQPDHGSDVRCFFREGDGHGVVKVEHLRDLGPGKLTVASHRNAIVTPGDAWMVEVVATAIVSEQRYVVR